MNKNTNPNKTVWTVLIKTNGAYKYVHEIASAAQTSAKKHLKEKYAGKIIAMIHGQHTPLLFEPTTEIASSRAVYEYVGNQPTRGSD